MARSVIDLLAQQAEEALLEVRAHLVDELARLRVEADQIEEALAVRQRRRESEGSDPLATLLPAGNGMPRAITRRDVYEFVRALDRPVTTAMLRKLLNERGHYATSSSVRNHLKRLADQDNLLRPVGDGTYVLDQKKEVPSADREPEGSLSSV